jgi:GNAT superfamily N-acetyltransferase
VLSAFAVSRGYFFDEHYAEAATLRDGTSVTLRLVRPSDAELLRRGFRELSWQSRYRRFHGAKNALSDREVRYFTELDGVDHLAIAALAVVGGGESGFGVARFVRIREEPEVAEAAVTVIDSAQNRGLGSLLLARLVSAARERGITRFRAAVLAGNQPMLELVHGIGPGVSQVRDGDQVLLDIDLPDLPRHVASAPEHEPIGRVLSAAARSRPEGSRPS